jgi:hydrogenase-4 membrane subunit HyfE
LIARETSSRPEAAFVLLTVQSLLWAMAGISAIPFALAGEIYMLGLGVASLLLALATCLLGIGVIWRRRKARRWVVGLEIVCLVGSLLVLLLPIGANHGPVSLMTNVAIPIAVMVLLRKPREAFS